MIIITKLQTEQEIARLAGFADRLDDDPLIQCDYGQFIQWLQNTVPQNPETFSVFCAENLSKKILGYLVCCLCEIPPVYRYGTIVRLRSDDFAATRELVKRAKKWGKECGMKAIAISTYSKRTRDHYAKRFGLMVEGWQLSGEI